MQNDIYVIQFIFMLVFHLFACAKAIPFLTYLVQAVYLLAQATPLGVHLSRKIESTICINLEDTIATTLARPFWAQSVYLRGLI